jgi:hypothetical protein
MVEFSDGIRAYKIKSGKILPKDEFSEYLQRELESHSSSPHIPDSELDFVRSMKFEVLCYRGPRHVPGRVY